jgi:hypothetical protein
LYFHVEIAGGAIFEFFLSGFIAFRIGQAGDAVTQQAAVQGGASDASYLATALGSMS